MKTITTGRECVGDKRSGSFDYAGRLIASGAAISVRHPAAIYRRGRTFLYYRISAGIRIASQIRQSSFLDPYRLAARVALNPSMPWAHAGVGFDYLLDGRFEEAASAAEPDSGGWARWLIVSCARWGQKKIPESDAALTKLKTLADVAAYQVAEAYVYRGEKDQAFEWLERARRQRDPGLASLRTDPLLVNLQTDPRWDALLCTQGLADDQLR